VVSAPFLPSGDHGAVSERPFQTTEFRQNFQFPIKERDKALREKALLCHTQFEISNFSRD
jgi:hypothetical protein